MFRLTTLIMLVALQLQPSHMQRHALAAGPAPTTCTAPLILSLQPGERDASGVIDAAIAADIPLDPVAVALPLYPGATATNQVGEANDVAQSTPYVKTAVATYLLPIDTVSAARWYHDAFAACDFETFGTEVSPSPEVIQQRYRSPTIDSLQIGLSFQPDAAGHTLLVYYAAAISLPPRDPDSFVPTKSKRVDLRYETSKPGVSRSDRHLHIHITQKALIQDLIFAVNVRSTIDPYRHGCIPLQAGADMTFVAGKTRTRVTVNPGCHDVQVEQFHRLSDDYDQTWNIVKSVVKTYCKIAVCHYTH